MPRLSGAADLVEDDTMTAEEAEKHRRKLEAQSNSLVRYLFTI